MNPIFEIQHTLTREQRSRFLHFSQKSAMLTSRICGGIGCAFMLAAFIFIVENSIRPSASDPLFYLLPICSLYFLAMLFFPHWFACHPHLLYQRRQYESAPVRYVFDEDFLYIKFDSLCNEPKTVPYPKMRSLIEADGMLYITNHRLDTFIVLPKAAFTPDSLTEFYAFIKEKTGKEFIPEK